jgi:hypothetical protein
VAAVASMAVEAAAMLVVVAAMLVVAEATAGDTDRIFQAGMKAGGDAHRLLLLMLPEISHDLLHALGLAICCPTLRKRREEWGTRKSCGAIKKTQVSFANLGHPTACDRVAPSLPAILLRRESMG